MKEEKEEEKKSRYDKEYEELNFWYGIVAEKDTKDLLLFNINNNLKRIADSLERIDESLASLDNSLFKDRG